MVQLPTHAPTGSAVSAMFQYHSGCLCKFGGSHGRDSMSRMQSEQMIHMAMFIFRIINIHRPFHQLPITSYFIRSKISKYMLPLLAFFFVYTQYLARLNSIQQNLTHHSVHKCRSLINRPMFRRSGRRCRICTVRFMPQIINSKIRTALYQVIACFFQKFQISCIVIIFPNMSSQPGTCHRIEVP